MKESDLLKHFPRLWHMAEDGSWESIRKHGLLSTSALLDLYKVEGADRRAIESERRPRCIELAADGMMNAIIRDNGPLTVSALNRCLDPDVSPQEWFEMLNQRAFFWLSRGRLRGLLNAKSYRGRPHTVLTVDTSSLLAAHRDCIELSPINSGSAIRKPQRRGRQTFHKIADYPFDQRRKTRTVTGTVAELVVVNGVPDILEHLVAAHTVHEHGFDELWRRSRSNPNDGP